MTEGTPSIQQIPQQFQNYNIIPLKALTKKYNYKISNPHPKNKEDYQWKPYQTQMYPRGFLKEYKGNLGLILGDPLGYDNYLTQIDIDNPELFQHFKDSETLIIKSGKGYHIYILSEKPPGTRNDYPIDDIEIRGQEGNYSVIPPSIHPNTKEPYTIHKDKPILQVEDAIKWTEDQLNELRDKFKTSNNTTPKKGGTEGYQTIYDPPNPPYPLERILREPVMEKLCSDEPWRDGNIRRLQIISSVLKASGWSFKDTYEYVTNLVEKWGLKYDDLERRVKFGYEMGPPNNQTIYGTRESFPQIGLEGLKNYLPEIPDYDNPMTHIHTDGFKELDDNKSDGDMGINILIELKYPTKHLKGYDELAKATGLYGDEYKIIFKTLYYQLLSYRIRKSIIKVGQVEVDCRIPALIPMKPGHGKTELKNLIRDYTTLQGGGFGSGVSLHAEQMIGKTVWNSKTKEHEHRLGYLSEDYFVADEAYKLLNSQELHYPELRKYIRIGLDQYPKNTLEKRTTEFGKEAPLTYEPWCIITLFVQPKVNETSAIVDDGDARRLIIPYTEMSGLDKIEALKNRILTEGDKSQNLKKFRDFTYQLEGQPEYHLTSDAKVQLIALSIDLIKYGYQYSKKIRNYTDTLFYTIQNFLLKLGAVQALIHNHKKITGEDVELAYLDYFELLHHTFNYIQKKVPGTLNDGENWQGAGDDDKECLMWLHNQGATSEEETKTTIKKYINKIMEVFKVQERQAWNIYRNQRRQGWINTKKKYQDSKIWLTFEPSDSNLSSLLHITAIDAHARSKNAIDEEFLLEDFEYYYLYDKYYPSVYQEGKNKPSACNDCSNMQKWNQSTASTIPTTTVANTTTPTTSTTTPDYHYDELEAKARGGDQDAYDELSQRALSEKKRKRIPMVSLDDNGKPIE